MPFEPFALNLSRRLVCSAIAVSAIACSQESAAAGESASGLQDASVTAAQIASNQEPDTVTRDSVANLPRGTVDTRYVEPTGRTVRVEARGDLQSALDRAQPGDVILLAPGATYTGGFVLPKRACKPNAWITVRTDLPETAPAASKERVTPATASRFAKLMLEKSGAVLKTANPTCGWWITGLELTASPKPSSETVNYGLVMLGDGGWREGGDTQTSYDKVSSRIVLDRVYLHGQATTNTTRCLALNSANSAVTNSWLSDCHAKGFDSQAIVGWNGPGPFLIENNYLGGAGENVMFGGGDPGIQGLSPSDITIRRNYVAKDPAWKGRWTVKNLFELKNARRVLVEGNIFENNWADGQAGMAIVIKSSGDANAANARWQGTTDLTFRNNVVRNSPRGVSLQAVDCSGQACVDVHVRYVRMENNLFENIGTFNGTGQDGWHFLWSGDLKDVSITHNTFVSNTKEFGMAVVMEGDGTAKNLVVTDNVFTNPIGYAVFHSGKKVGIESLRAFAGTSWTFTRNVFAGVNPEFAGWHPPGNYYPPIASIGFVDPTFFDYRLSAKSQFKMHGQGGSDPGVDMKSLKAAIEGVAPAK